MNITRNIDKFIFRAYDIRGTYNININEDVSYTIGKAYGTYIKKFNEEMCIIGHDNRLSSNSLNESLINGILSTGVNVIDVGLVTTPMLYYARILKQINAGIMVTASHNPKDDNGFKLSFNSITNAKGEEIEEFHDFVLNNSFDEGNGTLFRYNIKNEYIELFKKCLKFGNRRLKVVIDPGNGTTSIIAKELYSMFNIDLYSIYDQSDGNFPNHHPDPVVEENLKGLKEEVIRVGADVGIAFDGDGDRVGFVNSKGNVITADEYAVIVIDDILKEHFNKKILYDIKCSKIVKDEIERLKGTPIENRTGASYMLDRVVKENIAFGVEYSGHIYFNNEFPPITSGLYAGLKLLEIMSLTNKSIDELLMHVNKYYSTPEIKISFSDDTKVKVIELIKNYALSKNYNISEIDGIKVYFEDSWALIRCSNTGPNITLRFEANTSKRLEEIKKKFMDVINGYNYEKN